MNWSEKSQTIQINTKAKYWGLKQLQCPVVLFLSVFIHLNEFDCWQRTAPIFRTASSLNPIPQTVMTEFVLCCAPQRPIAPSFARSTWRTLQCKSVIVFRPWPIRDYGMTQQLRIGRMFFLTSLHVFWTCRVAFRKCLKLWRGKSGGANWPKFVTARSPIYTCHWFKN